MADEQSPRAGHNGLSEQGKAFVDRIENLNGDIERVKESIEEEIDTIKYDIKQVKKEAKAAGLLAAVNSVIAARKAEKKAEQARNRLDIADRDTFDNIRLALGDLADTDLGKAALSNAA